MRSKTNFSKLRTEISSFKRLELLYIQSFQPPTKHQNMFQENVAVEGFATVFDIRVIHIGGGDEITRTYRRQQSQVLYALHITCLSRSSFFWKKQETMMFRSGSMKHSPQNLIFPHLNHKFSAWEWSLTNVLRARHITQRYWINYLTSTKIHLSSPHHLYGNI